MAKRSTKNEYYCLAVRRDYETAWRVITKHDTLEQAEAELQERRGYTGAFNYDNAELRVLSRSEAKKEFGEDWEFAPIGGNTTKPKMRVVAKPARRRSEPES